MPPNVWTVEVSHPAETPNGESPVRRNIASRYGLSETPHPSIRTIYDLIQFNGFRWGAEPCFGTRKVIKIHHEKQMITKIVDGVSKQVEKAWMFWELGPFEYRTYREVAKEGLNVGAGLVKLGMGKGDKLAIYADTSYVFFLLELMGEGKLAAYGSRYLLEPIALINISRGIPVDANRHCLCNSRRRGSNSLPKRNRHKNNIS